jgi:hypothetical protein
LNGAASGVIRISTPCTFNWPGPGTGGVPATPWRLFPGRPDMGWLHKRKPVEAITDPSSGELSMSRILSWFMVILDIAWVIGCFFTLPAKEAYAPVSAFLAACTGASFTAYGLNSYAGARGKFSVGVEYGGGETPFTPAGPPPPRAKPVPPAGG